MQSGKYIFTTCEICGEQFAALASAPTPAKRCKHCATIRSFEARQVIVLGRRRAEMRRRLEARDDEYARAFPGQVTVVERGETRIETRGRALVAPRTNLNIFGVRLRGEI